MPSVSLSTLEYGARVLSDTVSDGHISQTEMYLWLSQGVVEWTSFLTESFGQMYNASSTTFNTSASVANYSLSTITGGTFGNFLGIDRPVNGQAVPMKPYSWAKRQEYQLDNIERYALVGDNIRFQPAPSGAESRTLWFEPIPVSLTNYTQTWDSKVTRGDEFVELCAAIKAVVKQERDPSALMAQKEAIKLEVQGRAKHRDASEPSRVQETRNDYISTNGPWWNWI